jgi:hypothetical protein
MIRGRYSQRKRLRRLWDVVGNGRSFGALGNKQAAKIASKTKGEERK